MPIDRDMAASKSNGDRKKSDNKVFIENGFYPAIIADVWLRYTDDEGHSMDAHKVAYTNSRGSNPGTMQRCKWVFELEGRTEVLDTDVSVLFGEKSNYTKVAGWFGYDVNNFDPEKTKGMRVQLSVECSEKTVKEGAGRGAKYWWSRVFGLKPLDGRAAAEAPAQDMRQAVEQQKDRLGAMDDEANRVRQEKLAQIVRINKSKGITSKEQLQAQMRDLCDDVSHFNNLPGAFNALSKYELSHLKAYADSLEGLRPQASAPATSPAKLPAATRPTGGLSVVQRSIIDTTCDALLVANRMTVEQIDQVVLEIVATGEISTATAAEGKALIAYLTAQQQAA